MRRSSLVFISSNVTRYSGNEPIYIKKSTKYGSSVYTWNVRFISLLDDFFKGVAIHNFADYPHDLVEKYVEYANGNLPTVDSDYDMIKQFDLYLPSTTYN